LEEQLYLAERILEDGNKITDAEQASFVVADALRLAELVIALNDWISRGGFLPSSYRFEESSDPT
jgi:hypothetical protein